MTQPLKIWASPELLTEMFFRDAKGNRLTCELGKPDADGFYTPWFTTHYDDNLVTAALSRLEAVERALRLMLGSSADRLEYCKANGLMPPILATGKYPAEASVDEYWRRAIAVAALAQRILKQVYP